MKEKIADDSREPGVLEAFGRRTQTHGLHYVLMPHYWVLRRILWAIAFFVSLLAFLWVTYDIMVLYFAYPVNVNTKQVMTSELSLPEVTICPQNPLKLTSLSSMGKYSKIKSNFETTNDWGSAVVAAGENLTSVAMLAGPALSDLVISCTIAGVACGNAASWKAILTEKGQCYTYTKAATQSAPGISGGLNLVLNTEAYDVSYDIGGTPGIQVSVHGTNERPSELMGDALDISPGFKANLKLAFSQTTRLPAPYGECSVSQMSPATCFRQCILQKTQAICGCVAYDYTGSFTTCTTSTEMSCVKSVLNTMATKRSPDCRCPPQCSEHMWTVSSTFSQLSEFALAREISNAANSSMATAFDNAKTAAASTGAPGVPTSLKYSENIVYVNVYYPAILSTTTVYTEGYSFMEHAKDHLISLLVYFGASVLSIVELIDLFCVALASCFKCSKSKAVTYA